MSRPTSTLVEIVLATLWLGGTILFASVVAPAVFAVLPTRTLAGAVVGRVLPSIFYSGIVVALVVIGLELRSNAGWSWRGRETGAAVMLIACGIAQFVIGPRIERLRGEIGGALESLSPTDPRRAAFGRLHGASVAWMGLAMVCSAIVVLMAARAVRSAAPPRASDVPGVHD